MFLIVGLGNPGKKYGDTRHNAGFMAINAIAVNFQFPIFKLESDFHAQISKGKIGEKEVALAKPQTFMNESWIAVKDIYNKKYKIEDIKHLIVIHDDIDLPLGKIRISQGSSAGGHKGIYPIIRTLTNKFIRLRIGTSPESGKPEDVESFVLENFTKKERKILEEIIEKTVKATEVIIKDGPEKAMNEFN